MHSEFAFLQQPTALRARRLNFAENCHSNFELIVSPRLPSVRLLTQLRLNGILSWKESEVSGEVRRLRQAFFLELYSHPC